MATTTVTAERAPATLPLPNALAYAIAAVDVAAALILPFVLAAGGVSLGDAVANLELQNTAVASGLGALILHRRPGHVIGWVLVLGGGFDALALFSTEYRLLGLPGGAAVEGLFAWCWVGAAASLLIALPQLFPDGRLLSARWRPLAYFGATATALVAIMYMISPTGTEPPQLAAVAFPLFGLAMLGSLVPLAVRFRRSRGEERQQFKWVFYGLAISIPAFAPIVASGAEATRALAVLTLIPVVVVPITITVAVLRYRLYDIDIVINKTLVFVVLAAFITAVYAAIVVGLGWLLPIGQGNLGLAIAATALVAVAFEPVRVRVQHWANRLVYGQRATPYEALAAMTARVGDTADPGAALAEAARLLAEAPAPRRQSSGSRRTAVSSPARPRVNPSSPHRSPWQATTCQHCRGPIWRRPCATKVSSSARCRWPSGPARESAPRTAGSSRSWPGRRRYCWPTPGCAPGWTSSSTSCARRGGG